jgi:hypothetical protein
MSSESPHSEEAQRKSYTRRSILKSGKIVTRTYTEIKGIPVDQYYKDMNKKYALLAKAKKGHVERKKRKPNQNEIVNTISDELKTQIRTEHQKQTSLRSIERSTGISRYAIKKVIDEESKIFELRYKKKIIGQAAPEQQQSQEHPCYPNTKSVVEEPYCEDVPDGVKLQIKVERSRGKSMKEIHELTGVSPMKIIQILAKS